MSRPDRIRSLPALSLPLMLVLVGPVAGCGGQNEDGSGTGGPPVAEPGQIAIPEVGTPAGSGEGGAAVDVPVTEEPENPGLTP
ncbi:hypothetical protein [Tautonia sociabilis]|uniref:Uncharacterized protein n=1 Tax=Tautonia sociabilis TaxID=2080755 RepID=A0A432MMR2_9BACT|nr:hypothetical protein [Tautonia sociabilis]RUL88712.1 hypothetical protein TsocGM_06135 [Tautonia sociabilis]